LECMAMCDALFTPVKEDFGIYIWVA